MADQTVQIEGDNGSPERVALDLMKYIRGIAEDAKTKRSTQELIDLYVDCRWAAYGNRNGGR